ncbi:hypothetical protein CPB85DRAFT_1431759 [Mucidula mucida]|nr:hypothetical protein CPB85DRAFT_1431759 [Mucidula mucida]
MAGPQPIDNVAEKLSAFDSVPLFMKSLPTDDTEDIALSALQSLAHEGTPDEVAENFKDQGNVYFRGKRYREALNFYTQGVDAKPTDASLLEALLCNRAACNLELQNYGSVLRDCSRVLASNPKSAKAYYRSANALLKLSRIDEALDCCRRCLEFDPSNKSVQDIQSRATKIKVEHDKKEKERQDRLRKQAEEQAKLRSAFSERNILVIPNPEGSQNPYAPHFDTDAQTLVFPVFFLYPQYATSDVIAEFVEDVPFAAHLETMFPPQTSAPEWDKKSEYVDGKLVVYVMTRRKRLLKVGRKMTLRDVCDASKAKPGEPRTGWS